MHQEYYQKSKEEIFKEFRTSDRGLNQKEIKRRKKKYGRNEIKRKKRLRPIKILISQFNSFLIYILLIASVFSFIIGNKIDGIVISSIVILNASLGFFQQYKAERAIQKLRKLVIPKSKVIRNGIQKIIPSSELVPGDLILFDSGDKINADCRIIESENLQTNEAILTGESLPLDKNSKKLPENTILSERSNMLYMGTSVVKGTSRAVIVSIGMKTEFGKIAENLQEIEISKTPMQKRLDKFSKQIGLIVLSIIGIVTLLGFLEHFDLMEIFLVSIALAVSAIPEGLPAVLAISFAISSLAMSKGNVIIRRLPAVESLGSVTVICSDKTGTITQERLNVEKIFANNSFYIKKGKRILNKNKEINIDKNKEIYKLFQTGILCNNARFEIIRDKYEIIGDPTEKALVSASLDLGLNKKFLIEKEPSIKKFEFDSKRKMMSVIRNDGKNNILYSKGAIEKILGICKYELVNGRIKNLSEKRKKEILKKSREIEEEALRVLAFAFRNFSSKEEFKEKDLTFLGFVGMIDPPREEVKNSISLCKNSGIKVKMITGDSKITAMAIAKQVGIEGKAITESELLKMTDNELKKRIYEIGIFARTSPNQKLRITRILQENSEVVAITGDGLNDSLALKAADVGIAMGIRGSDVARETSDVVLADDNFASIVEGVKQGRKTYDNIKKFTKYFLAVNFDEILLVLVTLFFKLPLPLLPLQILWINLITDSFPALSLVFEKEENVMRTKPREEKSILDNIWKFIIFAGLFAFAISFTVYLIGIHSGYSIEKIRTLVLTTIIVYELLFIYTCRSNKSIFKNNILSNKWINITVLFSIGMHLLLIYTFIGGFFGVVPLSIKEWIFLLPFVFSGLIFFEIVKLIKKNYIKKS
jgi:P-type Ca2+ transporter type 2C